jgi:ATP-dependent HslUV protease subunit HslV
LVANQDELLMLTGNGDVFEPDQGVAAIGSGGMYAQAAAEALVKHTHLSAAEIVRSAMEIAASMCIYTNDQIVLYTLEGGPGQQRQEEQEEDDVIASAASGTVVAP